VQGGYEFLDITRKNGQGSKERSSLTLNERWNVRQKDANSRLLDSLSFFFFFPFISVSLPLIAPTLTTLVGARAGKKKTRAAPLELMVKDKNQHFFSSLSMGALLGFALSLSFLLAAYDGMGLFSVKALALPRGRAD
jgi:hypothetical protein